MSDELPEGQHMKRSCRMAALHKEEGEVEYTRYIVPALLLAGWIVGCGVMVYIVFS
ncbi:DWARF open reading frame [Rhinatrema bivittatum]|uniref:DWARF open reading frame n=1 Tax=Rhinatrema bivittatum TaxID=194408 RepID=UPI001126D994|nr:DWARF open reading frame [Rhinatrema bivittatum]